MDRNVERLVQLMAILLFINLINCQDLFLYLPVVYGCWYL